MKPISLYPYFPSLVNKKSHQNRPNGWRPPLRLPVAMPFTAHKN